MDKYKFVRLDDSLYVNLDHIVSVEFLEKVVDGKKLRWANVYTTNDGSFQCDAPYVKTLEERISSLTWVGWNS